MSEDKKPPREFWIDPYDDLPGERYSHLTGIVHVIEKSAYSLLEKKLAVAVEALEQIADYEKEGYKTHTGGKLKHIVFWDFSAATDALAEIEAMK